MRVATIVLSLACAMADSSTAKSNGGSAGGSAGGYFRHASETSRIRSSQSGSSRSCWSPASQTSSNGFPQSVVSTGTQSRPRNLSSFSSESMTAE